MNIIKLETNYKRNLFNNISHVKAKKYSEKLENQIINVYPQITYQSFLGFGGAFTEASGMNFNKLPSEKKKKLLDDYFSIKGLNYSLGRLPIGSSDFSKNSYSYSNKTDLSDFSIKKDYEYIIPFLKEAFSIKPIKLLSSPWSPPAFMKSNKKLTLGGKLMPKYKEIYANYLVKYIKAYKEAGFNIDFMTVQNEPNATQLWESCLYSPEEECDFATNYLYPTFIKNNINTKILIWDHNKEKLYTRAIDELNYDNADKAISGFAYHYYTGDHFENIKLLRDEFPNKYIIHTESCTGYSHFKKEDEIVNAEIYAHDILGDLNYGTNGYIDWNLILDFHGGPNHKFNFCNSPIMLNKDNTDYIKNLSYYYIGQFSKFILPNAKRIAFSKYTDNIEVTAFKNVDDSVAIVLLNRNDFNKEYNLVIDDYVIHDNLDSHAIVSYLITP